MVAICGTMSFLQMITIGLVCLICYFLGWLHGWKARARLAGLR